MTTTYPGSLSLVRKHPEHVHGDNNDGTTTRAGKAAAMAGGIDLTLQRHSMNDHQQTRMRTKIVALACVVIVIVSATAVMVWRAYG